MRTSIAFVAFVLIASPALAQPSAEVFRSYVSVNGGVQATSTAFEDVIEFTSYVEEGTIDSSYSVGTGPQFDIAGGARLWRNLGVGVGFTRFSKVGAASVAAQIPHPFYFNRARAVAGEAADLKREEAAVHIQAVFFVPVGERMQVSVFVGPSFFSVKQGLVRDVDFTEQYPYDTAAFSTAETAEASESKVGYNVGADWAFFFSRNVGVGGVIRFSRASVGFESADGDILTIHAGGFQTGGGLRLRF